MIPYKMLHLIECLARYQAYQEIKNQPELARKVWGKTEAEEAQIVSIRRVKRKKNRSTDARPRVIDDYRDY